MPPATSDLPTTPIAGSSTCTATSCAASITSISSTRSTRSRAKYKVKNDTDVPVEGMVQLCDEYKKVFQKHFGKPFPQDPLKQLELAIEAVFKSWMSDKAVSYRRIENITGLLGTAVNCQSMVFGNMGDDSGTGVAFTRDPATGENKFYGEFLINAQGEDVVAGIRTPLPVDRNAEVEQAGPQATARDQGQARRALPRRAGHRVHDREGHAVHAANAQRQADRRGGREDRLRHGQGEADRRKDGRAAHSGRRPDAAAAAELQPRQREEDGRRADASACRLRRARRSASSRSPRPKRSSARYAGEKVLLVRKETNPEDIEGMHSAVGILTSTGGMTSHAAVVARGWGRCCVAGAGEITIDEKARKIKVGGKTFTHNDTLSIDGSTGEVMAGAIATQTPKLSGDFATVMEWADKYRTMKIRTNADTPADAKRAREFGAEGIGLCRTEHMFFEGDRIKAMRAMILADERKGAPGGAQGAAAAAAQGLHRHLQGDERPAGDDPPARSAAARIPAARGQERRPKWPRSSASRRPTSRQRVDQLHEMNPMLGHRGCRLAVTYPEILEMQVTAITEAVIACKQKKIDAQAEIMIPLVGTATRAGDRWPSRSAQTIADVQEKKKYKGKLDILGRHDDRDSAGLR